jgi:leucyl-tRNA synthetase
MILANEMDRALWVSIEDYKKFLQILAPFAPHVTEELWGMFGEKQTINLSKWPKPDEKLMKDEEVKIVIQINGKFKMELMIQADDSEDVVKQKALTNEVVVKHIVGREVKKVIYVKNRLINIVV